MILRLSLQKGSARINAPKKRLLIQQSRAFTSIDDPSSWNSGLSPDELFSSLGRYIKKAKNHEIAPALTKIRDILLEKHGHAIYLTEIAREASKWKTSPQNRNDLSNKLSSWLEQANHRT